MLVPPHYWIHWTQTLRGVIISVSSVGSFGHHWVLVLSKDFFITLGVDQNKAKKCVSDSEPWGEMSVDESSPYHWLSTSAAALQREFHASSLIVLDWKELLIKKIPAKAWLCQGRSQLPRTMFQCNTFPFQLGVSSSETPFPWIVDRSYCVCLDRGGGEDVKYGYESFTTGDKGGIEKNNMGMKLYIAEYR